MKIDHGRTQEVLAQFQDLDGYQAYYLKDQIEYQRLSPLVPETSGVLRQAFAHSQRVLDVGCGDGRTLLDGANLFGHGTGIDESAPHMIASALRGREAKRIRNVDFVPAKAINLPFADNTFDLVYSERGPLGHVDSTLAEALRVLKPGGLIFVETNGDFANLETENKRFARHGINIQTLACRTQTLVFQDFYQFLKYQCSIWVYMGQHLPASSDTDVFAKMLLGSTDESGRITCKHQTIWIAGAKDSVRTKISAGEYP